MFTKCIGWHDERKFGRIINISSVNVSVVQFGQTNYSAAKVVCMGYQSLAMEVAKYVLP